jgi:cell migration-inducing and hyaluronan-binding protein
MEHRWSNDDYGNGSYKTSVFHDVDGTVTGVRDSYILINDTDNGIAIDKTCEVKPTWNAAVCKGDVGRLSFNAPPPGGAFGALRALAPAPAAGAAAGPAAPAGPRPGGGPPGGGGGVFGRPAGPPPPPIIVSSNGKEFTLGGETNVRAGDEIKVMTERKSVPLRLSEMDKGSWVIFELPGFTKAASGTAEDSLDALRKSTATAYYKDKDALWVKVVSNGEGARSAGPGAGGTSVEVSR